MGKQSCIDLGENFCWGFRAPSRNVVEAEQCFQQALAIACNQQAKALELRAAMSLSSSLASTWQTRAMAHELLAEIYGWFTEGLDTADLQDARALLESLV